MSNAAGSTPTPTARSAPATSLVRATAAVLAVVVCVVVGGVVATAAAVLCVVVVRALVTALGWPHATPLR
jgi:predicted branched-subunit amino acid permease